MGKKLQKIELSSANWIVKSNALNEIRNNNMTISQIRLFSIYLSKINLKDVSSREVTFRLDEYTKIMQFKQTNTTRLIKTAEDLLGLTVKFWDKDGEGGFVICQLFKRFRLYKNKEGNWLVTIDCHDDVLKLMFDLRGYYFKYQLWNALQLTSPNQQRMYEILKQYEHAGAREISINDLREFLGMSSEEYLRWNNFRVRVLDASQAALANYTDIKFTWEISGKRGKGGKINKIKFNIEKNDKYTRQITLDDYLTEQVESIVNDEPEEFVRPDDEGDYFLHEIYPFLSDACNNEFNKVEIQVIYNLLVKIIPARVDENRQLEMFDYLKRKYDELKWRASRAEIKSRLGYLKKIIEADLDII